MRMNRFSIAQARPVCIAREACIVAA